MGLFSRIFGTDDAISKTIDTVSRGLDALVLTDEEKMEDAAKDRAEARSMVIEWMRTTQGQNLSRRFLALLISMSWASAYVVSMVMNVAAVWVDNPDKILASAQIISEGAERMNGAFMLVLGFYFALPHMDKIVKPAMDRFGRK